MSQICLLLINFDYLTYTDHHTFCLGFFERSFLRIIFFIPSFKNSARSVFRGFRIAHFTKWKLVDPCWSLVRFCGAVGSRKGDSPGMYISYIIDAMMQQIFILPLLRCDHFQFFLKSMFFFLSLLPEGNCNVFTETLPQHRQGVLLQNNFYRYANAQFFIPFCYCQLSEYSTCPWLLPCAYFLISESAAVRPVPHVRGCCRARAA